jgi:rod shape-determining protein MreC
MANRKHIFRRGPTSTAGILVLVVIALVLIFLSAFTTWLNPVRSLALDLVAPFYRVTDIPSRISEWTRTSFADREELLSEVQRLQDENLILQGRTATMADVMAENVRLRQLLNAAELVQARVLIAELVGIPPDVETHRIIVNRGRVQELLPGQPVIDSDGLVGQVVNVGTEYSEVLLISDRNSAVPIQIQRNGLRAIAEGTGDFASLRLRHVPSTLDIRVGDQLVTSGLGDRFPKGYPVGEITSVVLPPSSPYLEVLVKPAANLQSVRHMLILFTDKTSLQGRTPAVDQ